MEITTILWREWLFLKRRFWRVTFSQMVSPVSYTHLTLPTIA